MRLKRHVALFQSNLKRHVSARPLLSTQCQHRHHRRQYTQVAADQPEHIAVLGAGISGLASAHFIAKEFPKSKITVIERSDETGGWIKSRKVEVEGGDVVLEYGPRTLRPGAAALPTVEDLGLEDEILCTSKKSSSAKNRYIYYPNRLNCLPSGAEDIDILSLLKLWNSGILDGAWNIAFESWAKPRPRNLRDESVGDFLSRRVDKRIANNIVSAVFHGIYAGDIYQLSARTLLQLPWKLEGMHGSVGRGLFRVNGESDSGQMVIPWSAHAWDQYRAMKDELDLPEDLLRELSRQSTFTFKEGLQQLPRAIEQSLRQNEQVDFAMGTNVKGVEKVEGAQKIRITTEGSPESKEYDFVVSTLRDKNVTPFVNVMVVNLWFKNPKLVPVKGFGYLIPRSVPFEQNPERALGVIFDHDAITGQDSLPGTKLTVMLGGHWWDDWVGFPDNDEGAELAKSVLKRHLGITEEPDVCHVNLHKDAIAQYTVGYEDRMRDLDGTLRTRYGGRLRVVSSQFNGVGVNDCIKGAWELARGMRGSGWKGRQTGLEAYTDERPDVIQPVSQMLKIRAPTHV
ncbi:Protoporphyrinogen oxidase [Aaosphaeria arxii CBS 175.79]|uniref:Protoporphyrinogen oxidase n=1 Tax=Aaosphaeria arxii CBS 175.79 TaxID=1450172 RepID=A0A6A5XG53_9PLEO|nr:Protoporphyrinogen oxidase [Aaosphaeria arxii CBS 175.79]KAF2011910.1 Protoporphyrinogen oxidase [Aaosphaeria arxii CBS 175.79]